MSTVIARPGHTFDKDPDAELIYGVDWTAWLNTAATISASVWDVEAITGDAAPLVSSSASVTGNIAKTLLSGGTVGNTYRIRNRITTNETPAQEDDRSFYIRIVER
jgi:hypothetical protein